MNDRYIRQREALATRTGDLVEITTFGATTPEYLDNTPTPSDYIKLACDAYIKGDITLAELETEIDKAAETA